MRARHLLPAAPLLVLLVACNASTVTGTEQESEIIAQAPEYEVVSEETSGSTTQLTVAVVDTPQELAVEALVADLQEERTEDAVYRLSVLCASSQEEAATALWAQGEEALTETGFEVGQIEVDVDEEVVCDTT